MSGYCLDVCLLYIIYCRNHDLLEWLTHLDVHLAAQCQYHRSNLLGDGHTLLQVGIDSSLISYRELVEMYALLISSDFVTQYHAVLDAVKNGTLRKNDIEQAAQRVILWKIQLGLISF